MSLQRWERSDSVQAAAAEGTRHGLCPPPPQPAWPPSHTAFPPASLLPEAQRHPRGATARWPHVALLPQAVEEPAPGTLRCPAQGVGGTTCQGSFLSWGKWWFPVVTWSKVCNRATSVLHRAQPDPKLLEQVEKMDMLVARAEAECQVWGRVSLRHGSLREVLYQWKHHHQSVPPGSGRLGQLDVSGPAHTWHSMLARCGLGEPCRRELPLLSHGTCPATALQRLKQQLVSKVCAICNPCGFNVTGNVVI